MMNISQIPFEYTFLPDNPGAGETEGFPGNYNPDDSEGVDFRELCCDLVWYHFMEAWDCMKSFFEGEKIESIGFQIDLKPHTNLLASVRISRFRPLRSVETRPVFYISRGLLEEYLKSYWEKDYEIPFLERTALHHELIHVLDKYEEELFGLGEGRSRGKSVLLHLLRFRSEGIAELLCTLVSGTGVQDISTARNMFEAELYRVFEISWKHPKDYVTLSLNLPETDTFYEIGPWMILHVLGCPGNPKRFEMIRVVLENLERGRRTGDDIIFPLIRKALEITNFSFLKYLTEPGLDGQPFLSKKDMSLLVNVTGQIGLKRTKGICLEDRDSQIIDYYINKTIKLYNRWGRVTRPGRKKILKSS
ncbi:hypothetical protein EG832_17870, partial [bacterium]|nr:hypothetical protein [bacterium]